MALLTSVSLYAAPTVDLYLQGEIAAINDLTIVPTPNSTALNLTAGEVNRNVATVTETSNSLTGYSITIRTANGSQLNHTALGATYNVPYTVTYDGVVTPPLTTSDQVVKVVPTLTTLTTDTSDILVSFPAQANLPSGFYTDVVTISIAAN